MDHVQVYNDPQTQARDMVAEVDHPSAGKTKTLGVHIKLRVHPARFGVPHRCTASIRTKSRRIGRETSGRIK